MVKMIKDLKKDNEFLKSKCEKSDIAIVKLIEEVLDHLYKLFLISDFSATKLCMNYDMFTV